MANALVVNQPIAVEVKQVQQLGLIKNLRLLATLCNGLLLTYKRTGKGVVM